LEYKSKASQDRAKEFRQQVRKILRDNNGKDGMETSDLFQDRFTVSNIGGAKGANFESRFLTMRDVLERKVKDFKDLEILVSLISTLPTGAYAAKSRRVKSGKKKKK
jgi:hypothetical protein